MLRVKQGVYGLSRAKNGPCGGVDGHNPPSGVISGLARTAVTTQRPSWRSVSWTLAAKLRAALAMFLTPVRRMILMASSLRVAIMWGPFSVRTWERSSRCLPCLTLINKTSGLPAEERYPAVIQSGHIAQGTPAIVRKPR